MIRTAWTIVSVAGAVLWGLQAHAQTTDCTRTRNPVDREICSSEVLGDLERAIDSAQAAALVRDPGRAALLKQTHKQWISERFRVCSAGNIAGCLENLGRERL